MKQTNQVDLFKLKKHRGGKDAHELEETISGYRKKMAELQAEINQMTPNMRVSTSLNSAKKKTDTG